MLTWRFNHKPTCRASRRTVHSRCYIICKLKLYYNYVCHIQLLSVIRGHFPAIITCISKDFIVLFIFFVSMVGIIELNSCKLDLMKKSYNINIIIYETISDISTIWELKYNFSWRNENIMRICLKIIDNANIARFRYLSFNTLHNLLS